jgi:hypothetical protein
MAQHHDIVQLLVEFGTAHKTFPIALEPKSKKSVINLSLSYDIFFSNQFEIFMTPTVLLISISTLMLLLCQTVKVSASFIFHGVVSGATNPSTKHVSANDDATFARTLIYGGDSKCSSWIISVKNVAFNMLSLIHAFFSTAVKSSLFFVILQIQTLCGTITLQRLLLIFKSIQEWMACGLFVMSMSTAQGLWSTAELSVARHSLAAASAGNVAIFAGGITSGSTMRLSCVIRFFFFVFFCVCFVCLFCLFVAFRCSVLCHDLVFVFLRLRRYCNIPIHGRYRLLSMCFQCR